MASTLEAIISELSKYEDNRRRASAYKYFQAFPGGYGEGDEFIGVSVPNQRKVAKMFFKSTNLPEIEYLLNESVHEYRLTALFMLVLKYKQVKTESDKEDIVNVYVKNIEQVNNWDLVDSSAHLILGPHLFCGDTGLLFEFAKSKNIWVQRTAIIATMHFIRNNEFEETLQLAEMLLDHKHDIIHKAVGWMLREVGNKDYSTEYTFLLNNYKRMPRTMLRYAIEKFPEDVRQGFLKGTL
jgi:3-methyladenine DNA glycosylase AlkD